MQDDLTLSCQLNGLNVAEICYQGDLTLAESLVQQFYCSFLNDFPIRVFQVKVLLG